MVLDDGAGPGLKKSLKSAVIEYLDKASTIHPGHHCFLAYCSTSMQTSQPAIVDCLQEVRSKDLSVFDNKNKNGYFYADI